MRKVELVVLKADMDPVLACLGDLGCFQPVRASASTAVQAGPVQAALRSLLEIRDRLSLSLPEAMGKGLRLPTDEDYRAVEALSGRVEASLDEEASWKTRREQLQDALSEAEAFSGLALPFRELDHLSFLSLRLGHLEDKEIPAVQESLGERALILPVGPGGSVLALASKKGRFALDTELKRAGFQAKVFPPDFNGLPPELVPGLRSELEALELRKAGLESLRLDLAKEVQPAWQALYTSFSVARDIEEVRLGMESTALAYRILGWVPKKALPGLQRELSSLTSGRIGIRSWKPEELESVLRGEETVPVLLGHRAFVRSFERLVISYGAPLYGTIDPTPVVAFFFVLLFAIMFGDLGQGAVIVLTGLVLSRGWIKGLLRFRKFGPIFTGVGLGSMVMGLLVGSVFANEKALEPLTRVVSTAILGRPLDRFLSIMPESGSVGKLFAFFGFTLSVGVLYNSIGLVINMVNKWRLGKRGEALFGKTGLSGALFFWWALGIGIRTLLGGGPAWFDIPGLLLPLVGVFFAEPLAARLDGKHEEDEGAFSAAIRGIVDVLESVSYYFSNTLSFLRVGAFALSHAVLSFIVFAMGDLVRVRAPAGLLWEIVIVIIGNVVILVLEGMIVAIQVVRLNYYEFFSKFLTEIGEEFSPFRFEYRKE